MKNLQKFIVPLLIMVVIATVYFFYFNPDRGIGAFADFDPNNNASKEITVFVVVDRGITIDPSSGDVTFYGRDKKGEVRLMSAPAISEEELRAAKTVTVKGHMTKTSFHGHEIKAN